MEDREKDILELCKQVLEMSPDSNSSSNGSDISFCPLCRADVSWYADKISEFDHEPNCGYLIAKDLSVGLIKNTELS